MERNFSIKLLVGATIISIAVILIYFFSKNVETSNETNVEISLKQNADHSSTLVSSDQAGHTISKWKLDYPVFHFECADVNADGMDDILVGVIKKTRFDSVCRKRIFIFKLFEGYVRPLWLGSRVSQPLEDFKVIHSKPVNLICTIEQEKNGKYLIAEYKWKGFGLTFVKYTKRNINLQEAIKLFNQSPTDHENI